MPRPRIYLSGPLTSSGNVLENIDAAMKAARRLIDAGFSPLTPHLSYYLDPGEAWSRATWLEIDLPWLECADAVLRLPGESEGADAEVARALELGIPVFRCIGQLVARFHAAAVA